MTMSAKVLSKVNDFLVLPIQFPTTKTFPQAATHYLYLQPNAPRIPTEDTHRELFLVNVPIDATETHIRTLFSDQLGGSRVEQVVFEGGRVGRGITAPITVPKRKRKRGDDGAELLGKEVGQLPETWDRDLRRSGSTAVVRFVDQTSAQLALKEARKAVKNSKKIVWGMGTEGKVGPLGRARYTAHHKLMYPTATLLQASVDQYMAAFARFEAERARALAKQRAEPDEDGFIKVVRGGRTGPAREEAIKVKEEELKQREKDRVKSDFYRFQVREKKKEEAQKLINSFEDDKKRLEAMRKRRGPLRLE